LDEVGLGPRAEDDHEGAREPLCQVVDGMERGENVRYPRLVEDRQKPSQTLSWTRPSPHPRRACYRDLV
jgi:hypothetical protein